MTDKEIIKALKKHSMDLCGNCKVEKTTLCNNCISEIERNALALINRQQEENKNLKGHLEQLKSRYDNAKAEIERLQVRLRKEQHQFEDLGKMYSEIKAEAIKEYKEKLREHAYLDSGITGFQEMVVDLSDIENIADEMVGEGK